MKTILAPIDFSAVSDLVADEAAALAESLHARLVLLTIVQPPVIASDYGAGLENLQEMLVVSEKAADRNLARVKARLAPRVPRLETLQASGAAIPLIIEQARALPADFIVMGSHGHTALYDLLVGSTTHGVLKEAPCPVVILPPQPRKKTVPISADLAAAPA